jgi:hypothetical protein
MDCRIIVRDMNSVTNRSESIVVDPGKDDVRTPGTELPASPDPASTAASAEVERQRWRKEGKRG